MLCHNNNYILYLFAKKISLWYYAHPMTLFVNVKDNNVEQAIRSLKKKMQREGLYKEMKLRKHYEKPCLKRAREKEENIRRARKTAKRNND